MYLSTSCGTQLGEVKKPLARQHVNNNGKNPMGARGKWCVVKVLCQRQLVRDKSVGLSLCGKGVDLSINLNVIER